MLGPVLGFYLSSCSKFFLGNLTQTLNFGSQLHSDNSQKHILGPEFHSQFHILILIKLSLSSKLIWPKLSHNLFLFLKSFPLICLSHIHNSEIRVIRYVRSHTNPHTYSILNHCQVCFVFSIFVTTALAQSLPSLSSGLVIYYTVSIWTLTSPFQFILHTAEKILLKHPSETKMAA